MSDAELIRAIQEGDSTSLTTLYQRHVGGVWRYVHAQLVWDRDGTEDVVSETFLAAIRNVAAFDDQRGTAIGWLLGIARNKLRDHWRRAGRTVHCDSSQAMAAADVDTSGPSHNMILAETRDAVVRILDGLEDEQRFVLECKYVESLSVREIAARVGRTEKAVEGILYRARESFRKTFAQEQS